MTGEGSLEELIRDAREAGEETVLHSRYFYLMTREGLKDLGGEELLHYYFLEAMKE